LQTLPRSFADEMVAHALAEDPNECCGIIAGIDGQAMKVYRITNAERSPFRYNMEPRELFHAYRDLEDRGWTILAFYHSHTHSEAYPSATDVRLALANWPEPYYLLVSLMDRRHPVIRAFTIAPDGVAEEELQIS